MVGNLVEDGKELIKNYFDISNVTKFWDPDALHCFAREGSLTTISETVYDGYIVYIVGLSIKIEDSKPPETREVSKKFFYCHACMQKSCMFLFQLTVMHIYDWPDHKVAANNHGLCMGVLEMEMQQAARAAEGSPGMILNCSAGFYRSPTVLGIYMALQWLRHLKNKVVEPMAIMNYIRTRRLHALESEFKDKDDFEQSFHQSNSPGRVVVMLATLYKAVGTLMEWVKSESKFYDCSMHSLILVTF
jgi:Protein-tyrosine phosphatase